jgi:hypothetical protein
MSAQEEELHFTPKMDFSHSDVRLELTRLDEMHTFNEESTHEFTPVDLMFNPKAP